MSSLIQLNGTRRIRLGKGGARKARAAGQIPGVVYGHGEEPVPVAVGDEEQQGREQPEAIEGEPRPDPVPDGLEG